MASARRRALVTGANGFIGARVVGALLDAGWTVRGAVRDPGATSSRELAGHLAGHAAAGRFELVRVPDITAPGAFDAAVQNVSAIAHLATPMPLSVEISDPAQVIRTAVDGTLSILESAFAEASRRATAEAEGEGEGETAGTTGWLPLRSFVLMSSVAAIRSSRGRVATYTEADWNEEVDEMIREQQGGDQQVSGHLAYSASKVAAERAFWDFFNTKSPSFTATSLCPVWVAGPPLHLPSSPAGIAETNEFVWKVLSGQAFPAGPAGYGQHVDVRDVARVAAWAADSQNGLPGGRRLVVGGGGNFGCPQAAADVLRAAAAAARPDSKEEEAARHRIREGEPGRGYVPGSFAVPPDKSSIDASKTVEATGQDWIPYDKMILDTAKVFEVFL
ncbi:NAD(P)-binding protein [Xylariaceae sp. FL0804]|nr:NAD(P)-binding protein [Xylariaceae sp. FL0804]